MNAFLYELTEVILSKLLILKTIEKGLKLQVHFLNIQHLKK